MAESTVVPIITTEEQIHFRFTPKSPLGAAEQLYALSANVDKGDVSVTIDPDFMGGTIVAGSTAGDYSITFTGEGDATAGVDTLTDVFSGGVKLPEAATMNASFDAPVLKTGA